MSPLVPLTRAVVVGWQGSPPRSLLHSTVCPTQYSVLKATPNGFLGLRGPAHLLQRGPK